MSNSEATIAEAMPQLPGLSSPRLTTGKFEPFLNLATGWADFPGQYASAESILGQVPEIPLVTARYLPPGILDEEDHAAESIAQRHEPWDSDQLLERICSLEQTLLLVENPSGLPEPPVPLNENPAGSAGNALPSIEKNDGASHRRPLVERRKPTRTQTPLVRIDRGHVATPAQREMRAAGERAHRIDLPIAVPVPATDARTARHWASDSPETAVPAVDSWSPEAKMMTCLGLGAAWAVQLIIGLVGLASGPLPIWSLWLVAQTLGSICLGRVFWQVLAPRSLNSHDQAHREVSLPSRHTTLGNRDIVHSGQSVVED